MEEFDAKQNVSQVQMDEQLKNVKKEFSTMKLDLNYVISNLYPKDKVEMTKFLNVCIEEICNVTVWNLMKLTNFAFSEFV